MALQDVTNTLTTVLNRRDMKPAQATVFLNQGVARLQRLLRIPSMERAQIVKAVYLPFKSFLLNDDVLQLMDVMANGVPLNHVSYRQILRMAGPSPDVSRAAPTERLGQPEYYARLGASLFLHPILPLGGEMVVTYYGKIDPLVNPTDENEITRACPDLLVYASLTFAADYFQMDQRDEWEQTYQSLLAEVQDQSAQTDILGGSMVMAPTHGQY